MSEWPMELRVAVIAAGAALAGALVGALGAWIVAWQNRREARRERFADTVRTIAAELLRGAEGHARQVATQVAWRFDPMNVRPRPEEAPAIGSTDPLYLLVAELHLTVRRTRTADLAWRLYQATVFLDHHAFTARLDLEPDGLVRKIDRDRYHQWEEDSRRYNGARGDLINAVREELGAPRFAHQTPF